jgi:hypothetical protein
VDRCRQARHRPNEIFTANAYGAGVRRLVIPLALCAAVIAAALSASGPRAASHSRPARAEPTRSLSLHVP